MRYGDLITIQRDGIHIEPKELEPIGIFPGADCWGVQLHLSGDDDGPKQNLLISPFRPASWPVLLRFVLRLKRNGTALHKAASVFAAERFNILSYDCTPSGNHHLTWTLVGENAGVRLDPKSILKPGRGVINRTFDQPNLVGLAQHDLAPEMLRYGMKVADALRKSDKEEPFLEDAFNTRGQVFGGKLYCVEDLPNEYLAVAGGQEIKTISWKWLQDMAFFWLFGGAADHEGEPLRFCYDPRSHSLRLYDKADQRRALQHGAGPTSMRSLAELVPARVLALFDSEEQYMRVLIDDRPKVRVEATYGVDHAATGNSTCGLLRDVLGHLQASRISVLHVANSTRHLRPTSEDNSMVFVGEADATLGPEQLDALLNNKPMDPENWLNKVRGFSFTVSPITPHSLFISTRVLWSKWRAIDGHEGEIRAAIVTAAHEFGFEPVILDDEQPSYRPRGVENPHLLTAVFNAIRSSSAFLLIVPKMPQDQTKTDIDLLRWMNWEFGVAAGADVPWRICLDIGGGGAIKDFHNRLVADGLTVGTFESDGNTGVIIDRLRRAVSLLSDRVHKRVPSAKAR